MVSTSACTVLQGLPAGAAQLACCSQRPLAAWLARGPVQVSGKSRMHSFPGPQQSHPLRAGCKAPLDSPKFSRRSCRAGLDSVMVSWAAPCLLLRRSKKALMQASRLGARCVMMTCSISCSETKRSRLDTAGQRQVGNMEGRQRLLYHPDFPGGHADEADPEDCDKVTIKGSSRDNRESNCCNRDGCHCHDAVCS